jgi:adenylylsulfate kinase-like enzyme
MDVVNESCDSPVTGDPVPLLWLYGPPGVGKSTVGWQFFSQLTRDETRIGYLDIDQLGMCYPAPASDPDRHRIKAQNLGAMVTGFEAGGAQCVLVSGVVDEIHGVRNYVGQIPQTVLTLCRLRAHHDVLAARLAYRGLGPSQVASVLRELDILNRGEVSDLSIDTSGLTVAEVIQCLREKTGAWPALTRRASPPNSQTSVTNGPTVRPIPGSILWICGATGVGKSTVGWRVFEKVRCAGVTAAFVDLEQIGFFRPVPGDDPENHRIKAHNLAGLWRTFHGSGARCLIVVGPVNDIDTLRTYRDALPGTTLKLCRLHAGSVQLAHRIKLRGQGFGPKIPGDALNGKPLETLHQIARRAAATADALQHEALGDLCIDTDGLTVEEAAQKIMDQIDGWP